MKILLYPHGGSGNHGCEAIVRSTGQITESYLVLASNSPNEDLKYGLCDICDEIIPFIKPIKKDWHYLTACLKYKFFRDPMEFDRLAFKHLFTKGHDSDVALSIGGDNYCYGVPRNIMFLNQELRKKNVPTVLWGCSIEPMALTPEVIRDLNGYKLIIARESITHNALLKHGIKQSVLLPDPAFSLKSDAIHLPDKWKMGNTIGINASPMIMDFSQNGNLTLRNYEYLIEHILKTCDSSIALIPHVVWQHNDDRKPLRHLYDKYSHSNRVILFDDEYNAEQLKWIISQCRTFITARTHASIAAYSTCVPTLVLGYSVKAKGIATDIFGSWENYILPVQSIESDHAIVDAFNWIMKHEIEIKKHLASFMPSYCDKTRLMKAELDRIL